MTETDEFVKWFIRSMAVDLIKGKEITYNKQMHIMGKDSELQAPSEIEIYKFNIKDWSIKIDKDYLIVIKK